MLLLHHAAAHRDDLPRLRLFCVRQRADVAQHAHFRVLAHGAGVDDDDVRGELILREAAAHLRQIPAQLLAVRLVLLAAVGVHHRKLRHALAGIALGNGAAYVLLLFYLRYVYYFSFVAHCVLSFLESLYRISDVQHFILT